MSRSARVPGLGVVEWSAAEVDDYAVEIAQTHLPGDASGGWWRHWRSAQPATCTKCGDEWPCSAAWWADRWRGGMQRRRVPADA